MRGRYRQNGHVSSSFRHGVFAPAQPFSARAWLAPITHPVARSAAGSATRRASLLTNIALTVAASFGSLRASARFLDSAVSFSQASRVELKPGAMEQ